MWLTVGNLESRKMYYKIKNHTKFCYLVINTVKMLVYFLPAFFLHVQIYISIYLRKIEIILYIVFCIAF